MCVNPPAAQEFRRAVVVFAIVCIMLCTMATVAMATARYVWAYAVVLIPVLMAVYALTFVGKK